MLPASGYVVIAFLTDNPGAWLCHCRKLILSPACRIRYQFLRIELLGSEKAIDSPLAHIYRLLRFPSPRTDILRPT